MIALPQFRIARRLSLSSLALDLQFAADKSLTARVGPTPSFSRASSATYVDSSGNIAYATTNVARFDHRLVGSAWACKGLLIEEAKTNIFNYSEDFTNAYWFKNNVTYTANDIASPDGSTTADKMAENSATGYFATLKSSGATVSTGRISFSVFLKKGTRDYGFLQLSNGSGTRRYSVAFDFAGGSITSTYSIGSPSGSYKVTSLGSGWFRIAITFSCDETTCYTFWGHSNVATPVWNAVAMPPDYAGDTGKYSYSWGSQLEQGDFASSYIPSTGAAATTRASDICFISGAPWSSLINTVEGTFVTNHEWQHALSADWSQGVPRVIDCDDGGNNELRINGSYASPNKEQYVVRNGGGTQCDLSGDTVAGLVRTAAAYKANDFGFCINGGSVLTDVSGSLPTWQYMAIGYDADTAPIPVDSRYNNGWIAAIQYYNQRLSNANLQTLTT